MKYYVLIGTFCGCDIWLSDPRKIMFSRKLEYAERFELEEAKERLSYLHSMGGWGLRIEPEPLSELTIEMTVAMWGFKP